ncbi:MAG: thymidylate kinase [bacterium]
MTTGKFIVIDGTDGSGKGTQTDILIQRLQEAKYSVFKIDFPQYGQKSAGLVEEYLNGKYGSAQEVGPYMASIFYAVDRFDASNSIRQALLANKIVVANRYVTSNMGHQGGKIADDDDRRDFFAWLENLEYNIFNIPKPNLNLILHVDAALAQELVDHKESRDYIHGQKRDIHEADLNHLRLAEKVYLQLADIMPNAKKIECVKDGQIMTREAISDLVWQEVMALINMKLIN